MATQCPYCQSTRLVIQDRQQRDPVGHAMHVQCLECGYCSLTIRSQRCDGGGMFHAHSQMVSRPDGISSARASASAHISAKKR